MCMGIKAGNVYRKETHDGLCSLCMNPMGLPSCLHVYFDYTCTMIDITGSALVSGIDRGSLSGLE